MIERGPTDYMAEAVNAYIRENAELRSEINGLLAALKISRECLGACIGTPDWYRAKAAINSALSQQSSKETKP